MEVDTRIHALENNSVTLRFVSVTTFRCVSASTECLQLSTERRRSVKFGRSFALALANAVCNLKHLVELLGRIIANTRSVSRSCAFLSTRPLPSAEFTKLHRYTSLSAIHTDRAVIARVAS